MICDLDIFISLSLHITGMHNVRYYLTVYIRVFKSCKNIYYKLKKVISRKNQFPLNSGHHEIFLIFEVSFAI